MLTIHLFRRIDSVFSNVLRPLEDEMISGQMEFLCIYPYVSITIFPLSPPVMILLLFLLITSTSSDIGDADILPLR